MKFYRFGNEDKPDIMLLPGTCCHWKTFSAVIPLLKDTFQVVCISYDGFDENEPDAIFTTMTEETKKIEGYIKAKFGGRIFAAYGCSLGGSFVGLLIGREKIHIDHGFIGSSDLDQAGIVGARIQSAIVKPVLGKAAHDGKLPEWMTNMMLKKAEDPKEAEKNIKTFEKLFASISFASEKSIYNQFYSDLVTPLKDNIRVEGTTVHIFYALKMGEKYFDRYNKHFPDADIVARDYSHEQLLISYPEQWAQDIKRCCGLPFDEEKALPESLSYRRGKKRFFDSHHYEEAVVKGCNFKYMDCGKGDKTIVFLVGGLGTSEAVYPYVSALEGRYRFITFDYPFECMDMKSLCEAIIDLLDYLDVDKAVWMGASFGVYMAQLLASEFNERTEAMCLFSTAALSERTVGATFEKIFNDNKNSRIIIATFASNVDRVQQIINSAVKYGRKVCVEGRSMVNIIEVAEDLDYLKIPDGTLIETDEMKNYTPEQIVLITTGSQGESMAALSRMAANLHRKVSIQPGDCVVFSSTPIPGNEKSVAKVINELGMKGAKVIFQDTHVSGHACQEEIKLIYSLVKPKYSIPVHGEYRHLVAQRDVVMSLGYDKDHVIIAKSGDVLELNDEYAQVVDHVQTGAIFVDGLGVGDVGNIVLRDRQNLAENGIIIVVLTLEKYTGQLIAGPDIVTRGFVYVREAEELLDEARAIVSDSVEKCLDKNITDWSKIKHIIKDDLSEYLWKKIKRNPVILPIIMEAQI